MIITLTLTHAPEFYSPVCRATIPESWTGSTPAITFGGNTFLLGEEYPLRGSTRQEVIDRAIAELRARGLSGTLRVRG